MKVQGIVPFVLIGVLVACPPAPQPPVSADCAGACEKMVRLGCTPATTPGGHSCQEVCEHLEGEGLVHWPISCITDTATTNCDDIDRCRSPH